MSDGASLRPRRSRSQDGAAAVEFALVLPILLLVVFGVIAYGFVFAAQLSMNSSARDAARAGVVQPITGNPMTCQAVALQAKNASSTIGLTPSKVSVQVSSPTASGSPACKVAADGSASGSTGTTMCTGSSQDGQLVVLVTYDSVKVPVPMVPVPGKLTATGSFQCEYS